MKYIPYILPLAFIILDLITGLLQSLYNKQFKSSCMRSGLYHKVAEILILVLAYMIDYAMIYYDLGFDAHTSIGVTIYIILMEIGSIYENIRKINPSIDIDTLKGSERD